MSSKADNGNPGKSNLDNEIKRVFVILKHELMFSEKNSFYENIILKIKTLDKFISYKIVIFSVRKIFFVNIGLLFVMLWKLSSFLKQYKPPIPKEEISSMLPVLFLVLVLLCFFPILLLIELIAVNLSGQRNSEDILLNIEKRTDYLLTDESMRIIEETNSTYDKFNFHSISIETFVLDSLKAHFEYLLKQEEKNKDKANAIGSISTLR